MKWLILLALIVVPFTARADDPPAPPVPPAEPAIVAPKEATGTGKRLDPFVFDSSTKCVLRLTGAVNGVKFDLEDAPTNIEVIDRALVFSLAEPGLFQVIAHGDGLYAKCWFEVKGPNGPPPVPDAAAILRKRLRDALVGDNAKADAAKLHGMTGTLADALESGQFANYGQMFAAWKATQAANKWPAGIYPKIPDVIRLAIPTAEDSVVLDSNNKPAILANLRVLEQTAEAIANGR